MQVVLIELSPSNARDHTMFAAWLFFLRFILKLELISSYKIKVIFFIVDESVGKFS